MSSSWENLLTQLGLKGLMIGGEGDQRMFYWV